MLSRCSLRYCMLAVAETLPRRDMAASRTSTLRDAGDGGGGLACRGQLADVASAASRMLLLLARCGPPPTEIGGGLEPIRRRRENLGRVRRSESGRVRCPGCWKMDWGGDSEEWVVPVRMEAVVLGFECRELATVGAMDGRDDENDEIELRGDRLCAEPYSEFAEDVDGAN